MCIHTHICTKSESISRSSFCVLLKLFPFPKNSKLHKLLSKLLPFQRHFFNLQIAIHDIGEIINFEFNILKNTYKIQPYANNVHIKITRDNNFSPPKFNLISEFVTC